MGTPPSAIVDEHRQLVHVFGELGSLLKLPAGRTDLNILKMAEAELAIPLGEALEQAMRERREVTLEPITLNGGGGAKDRVVELFVRPLRDRRNRLHYAVVFGTPGGAEPSSGEFPKLQIEESVRRRVENLDSELQATKESLQATIEELITVNAEYQKKIEKLSELTADMDNLYASTSIGTIFLDDQMRIRKFTPPVAGQMSIIGRDVGRPLTDLAHRLDYDRLTQDIEEVMRSGETKEVETRNDEGAWYLIKIMPYSSESRQIEGIVVSLIDITRRKRGEEVLGVSREKLASLAYNDLHSQVEDLEGNEIPDDQLPVQRILLTGSSISDYCHRIRRGDKRVTLRIRGSPIYGEDQRIEGAVFDLLELKNEGTDEQGDQSPAG